MVEKIATATISKLNICEIKSCKVRSLLEAELVEMGLKNDGRFVLVDDNGNFLSQRKNPEMARMVVNINPGGIEVLRVSFDGKVLEEPINTDAGVRKMQVQLWNDLCKTVEVSPVISRWFSEMLQERCSLVAMDPEFKRLKNSQPHGFRDSYPVSVGTTASLAELNRNIRDAGGDAIPMDRFRLNLILDGFEEPWVEDGIEKLILSDGIEIRFAKPIVRCPIPQINQETGKTEGAEPNKTLIKMGRVKNREPIFGQKANSIGTGVLRVGDKIKVVWK